MKILSHHHLINLAYLHILQILSNDWKDSQSNHIPIKFLAVMHFKIYIKSDMT